MALRDENPFIDADLQLIITTYESGVNSQDSEESLYPVLASSLIRVKMAAQAAVTNVQSYLTKTTEVSASDLVDRVTATTEADRLTKLGDFLSDCIPCSLRPDFNKDLPDLSSMGDLFEKDIQHKLDHLKDIEDVMKSPVVFDGLCELLNTLKVNCIPDLVRILGLLKILLSKMSINMSNVQKGIFGLALSFLSSILQGIASLLDKFDLAVTNPVECILTQLEIQYAELNRQFVAAAEVANDVQTGLETVRQEGQNRSLLSSPRRESARERSERLRTERQQEDLTSTPKQLPAPPREAISSIKTASNSGAQAVLIMKEYLQRALTLMREKLEYYIQQVQEFLKLEQNQDSSLIDFLKSKQELIRSIAAVKALVEGAKNGISCGQDRPLTLPELNVIGDIFARPGTRAVSISPEGDITVAVNPRVDTFPAVVIKSKSCLKTVTEVDLAKLSSWAEELDAAIPDL